MAQELAHHLTGVEPDANPGLSDPTALITTMYLLPKLRPVAYILMMETSPKKDFSNLFWKQMIF